MSKKDDIAKLQEEVEQLRKVIALMLTPFGAHKENQRIILASQLNILESQFEELESVADRFVVMYDTTDAERYDIVDGYLKEFQAKASDFYTETRGDMSVVHKLFIEVLYFMNQCKARLHEAKGVSAVARSL